MTFEEFHKAMVEQIARSLAVPEQMLAPAPLTPCDCRRPAPSRKSQRRMDYIECLGCRGWISLERLINDNIPLRD
ncbi:hypothetical protein [Burkholderia ubonensis]|uniref:hypothetical protein n=1 Tax=Burkholderia ubonensis TaxID=101571 RepID=UPI0007589A6E|nr:hypothetical protein [Burkholderia ubonensis]KVV12399.1 hypothetical protein WK77_06180 [Burkholderia ubonensis]OJB09155.1 hypothetical protein BGV48_14000 [Burkholderia ubonensis]